MGFAKTGEWEKVGRIVSNLSKTAVDSRNESLKNFGLKAESISKGHMSNQDLGWKPLKEEYKNRKLKRGLSNNILIATSTYFQSITSFVFEAMVFIGVRRGVMSADGKTELIDIAPVHEFGSESKNIAERPLWKPTLAETIAWHVKNNLPEMIFLRKLNKMK